MKKYSDGKRTINATEKAFNLIYSAQGFKEVKGSKGTKTPEANPENKDNKKDDAKGTKTPEANPENKDEGKGDKAE